MITTYNGNDVFSPINFGLYPSCEDIDQEQSKEAIQEAFTREYSAQITDTLEAAGLKFHGFNYYSPAFYNFSTDSLDLKLEIVDRDKLNKKLEELKPAIITAMAANKSYDGYMALTADKFDDLINDRNQLDIIAVTEILKSIDFSDFDPLEHIVRDTSDECDSCRGYHEGKEEPGAAEYCDRCMDQQHAYNSK